jgi:decaprenylphospho-beta-D-ribofuranose 2-oxidase
MILSGWGQFPAMNCRTRALRDTASVGAALVQSTSLIARGNGRAYGDAALNPEMTLMMSGCDRLLQFEKDTGLIECEAGLLLSDLLDIIVPHGWFPPVVPGTKFVSIGGLIAADVHGKNHHRDGSVGRYVESLRLALADGTVITCSRSENSEIFEATLGGMGLTGIILSARFRLRAITTDLINETIIQASSLETLLQLFEKHSNATYSVAWIDCLARGRHAGRSILLVGEHVEVQQSVGKHVNLQSQSKSRSSISVPIVLPVSVMNTWSIKLFNEIYYRFQRPGQRVIQYDQFFFPLDAVRNWNRIYGRRGFIQYQCVIGGVNAKDALHRILNVVVEMGQGSFLAVLKKLGTGNRFLSFPMEGYTITLDFPVRAEKDKGMRKLDAIVSECRGRIYLAKDARAPRDLVEKGYAEIDSFRKLRRDIDPSRKIRSVLSERLDL